MNQQILNELQRIDMELQGYKKQFQPSNDTMKAMHNLIGTLQVQNTLLGIAFNQIESLKASMPSADAEGKINN